TRGQVAGGRGRHGDLGCAGGGEVEALGVAGAGGKGALGGRDVHRADEHAGDGVGGDAAGEGGRAVEARDRAGVGAGLGEVHRAGGVGDGVARRVLDGGGQVTGVTRGQVAGGRGRHGDL